MADIKISQLNVASQLQDADNIELSQNINGTMTSTKTSIGALTEKVTSGVANSIAPVEISPSGNNYAVGDYLMYGGQLYKVISAITSGQTLVVGTNITAVTVTDEMGSGSGGGTTVIANPTGTPTDDLNTIQIGNEIFNVVGSGGEPAEEKVLETIELQTGDTLADILGRIRDYYDDKIPFRRLRLAIDGTNNAVFVCSRYQNNVSLWTTILQTGSGSAVHMTAYAISISSSSVAVRKYDYTVSETTITRIETDTATSDVEILGLDEGTGGGGDYYAPVIYSTEEREVGVWTDGKPLYQKTFILNPTQATETIDISSLHIDKMVSRNTTCARDTGSSGIQQKDVQYRSESVGSDTYGLICEIRGTDLYFDISGYNYSQITEIRATLQYTKTTDVAGSGSWTPQGVPAVHYSTGERIIGTWNGETLYENTIISDLTLSTASWQNYISLAGLNLLSVDKVIITRDGEQVPMAFSPYMIVAWIVRDNHLKFIIQSSTSVSETIILKSCVIQYTKTS